ncbi:MAG: extracellular solute-binding protein family 1 [Paenibacillus sp.]|jgi:multiple sugar transport system substrate-binding protein|nr:extracellular solute-binding protein family 1 [Paenibacillus sp.]
MKKMKLGLILGLPALLALAAGCGASDGEKGKTPATEAAPEPVTLTFRPSETMTDAQVEKFIKEPLKKKFPHITLEVVRFGNGVTWESAVSANQVPDLFATAYKSTELFVKLQIAEDLSPFIAKHKLDIGKFEPVAVNTIKSFGTKGELFGLPYETHYGALFYNKDIFDKFGVSYPKDGLTWDEAIAIGKNLTRTESGLTYIGLDPSSPAAVNVAVGHSVGTGDIVKINNESWKEIFSMLQKAYEVPGFVQDKKYTYGVNSFLKDRNLAMFSSWENDLLGKLSDALTEGNPMNWDMVTHPNFKENLGQGRDAAAHAFFISNKSKYKEEAFQVMKMVTEPEVQSLFNRNGVLTVLSKTEEVKKEYGKEIPVLQGKNTAAIFKMTPSPVVSHTYYSIISSQLTKAAGSVALKQKDVNTALRDAEEEATKLIAVELKK